LYANAFRFFWTELHAPLRREDAWPTTRRVMRSGFLLEPEARNALGAVLDVVAPSSSTVPWCTELRSALHERHWPAPAAPASPAAPSAPDAPAAFDVQAAPDASEAHGAPSGDGQQLQQLQQLLQQPIDESWAALPASKWQQGEDRVRGPAPPPEVREHIIDVLRLCGALVDKCSTHIAQVCELLSPDVTMDTRNHDPGSVGGVDSWGLRPLCEGTTWEETMREDVFYTCSSLLHLKLKRVVGFIAYDLDSARRIWQPGSEGEQVERIGFSRILQIRERAAPATDAQPPPKWVTAALDDLGSYTDCVFDPAKGYEWRVLQYDHLRVPVLLDTRGQEAFPAHLEGEPLDLLAHDLSCAISQETGEMWGPVCIHDEPLTRQKNT